MNGNASQEILTTGEIFDYCNESANKARELFEIIVGKIERGQSVPSDADNAVFFLRRERMFRCEIPDIICEIVSKKTEGRTNE